MNNESTLRERFDKLFLDKHGEVWARDSDLILAFIESEIQKAQELAQAELVFSSRNELWIKPIRQSLLSEVIGVLSGMEGSVQGLSSAGGPVDNLDEAHGYNKALADVEKELIARYGPL